MAGSSSNRRRRASACRRAGNGLGVRSAARLQPRVQRTAQRVGRGGRARRTAAGAGSRRRELSVTRRGRYDLAHCRFLARQSSRLMPELARQAVRRAVRRVPAAVLARRAVLLTPPLPGEGYVPSAFPADSVPLRRRMNRIRRPTRRGRSGGANPIPDKDHSAREFDSSGATERRLCRFPPRPDWSQAGTSGPCRSRGGGREKAAGDVEPMPAGRLVGAWMPLVVSRTFPSGSPGEAGAKEDG